MVTAAISVVNRVKHFVASMLGSSDGMNPMEHPEDILFIPPVVDEGILRQFAMPFKTWRMAKIYITISRKFVIPAARKEWLQ